MFFVYILYSKSLGKYYVGHTNDFERRLHEHNSGQTKYSSKGIPWILVYKIEIEDRSAAMILQIKVKKRGISRYLNDIGVA